MQQSHVKLLIGIKEGEENKLLTNEAQKRQAGKVENYTNFAL